MGTIHSIEFDPFGRPKTPLQAIASEGRARCCMAEIHDWDAEMAEMHRNVYKQKPLLHSLLSDTNYWLSPGYDVNGNLKFKLLFPFSVEIMKPFTIIHRCSGEHLGISINPSCYFSSNEHPSFFFKNLLRT